MAIKELSAAEFGRVMKRSEDSALRAMNAGMWNDKVNKKQYALIVTEKKSAKGKPSKFVLWDDVLNQPATDLNAPPRATTQTAETVDSVGSHFFGESNVVSIEFANQRPAADRVSDVSALYVQAPASTLINSARFEVLATQESAESVAGHDEQHSILSTEEKTTVLAGQNLAVTKPDNFNLLMTKYLSATRSGRYQGLREKYLTQLSTNQKLAQIIAANKEREFEEVFAEFLAKQLYNSEKSTRSHLKKQYEQAGKIPPILLGKETRGRHSLVDEDIVTFLIDFVKKISNPESPVELFWPKEERTVPNLMRRIEEEFTQKIPRGRLDSLIHKHNLRILMDMPDGISKEDKKKGFWKRLAVCALWLMDGVVPRKMYIRNGKGGWTNVRLIGIEDVGSRVLLGLKEYYSESADSSVDLFKQVMTTHDFRQGTLIENDKHEFIAPTLRPDQGSGFVSSMDGVSYAISELYAATYGFLIDYHAAKAGDPKGKAGLESSWKMVHGRYTNIVRKKFANRIFKMPRVMCHKLGTVVAATYYDITLDELRASGAAQEYLDEINNEMRTFRENNSDISFVPNERWQEWLEGKDPFTATEAPAPKTFSPKAEELILLDVFGGAKPDAAVKRNGVIRYNTQDYQVDNDTLFSKSHSTDVRVSELSDGRLAIFTAKADSQALGKQLLCYASLLADSDQEKLKHVKSAKKAKVEQLHEKSVVSGEYKDIIQLLSDLQIKVISDHAIRNLIAQGLTLEMSQQIVKDETLLHVIENHDDPAQADKLNKRRYDRFQSQAIDRLNKIANAQPVRRLV